MGTLKNQDGIAIPLKAPKGGHRRLPNFGKAFGAIYASARWGGVIKGGIVKARRLCFFRKALVWQGF